MPIFLSDAFTEASDVVVTSHTPDVGSAYAAHPNKTAGVDGRINSAADRYMHTSSTASDRTIYYNNAAPAGAEYLVEVDFVVVTVTGNMGVLTRVNTTARTYYEWRYSVAAGMWEVYRWVNNAFTLMGSFTATLSAGVTYRVKVQSFDTSKKMFIDNVERISFSDNTITAAGLVGMEAANWASAGASNGIQLDNLTAYDRAGLLPAPPSARAHVHLRR